MIEFNYPEERGRTVALVNIGARYSSINIIHDAESLFTGDIGVGGRLYTDALCETLQLEPQQAEAVKFGGIPPEIDANMVHELLDRTTDHLASELQRQLGFFWNAAATDHGIEQIYLSGGGAQTSCLVEELSAKTGVPCAPLNCFKRVEISSTFDQEYLNELAPSMAVSVGLALRRPGDKKHAVH